MAQGTMRCCWHSSSSCSSGSSLLNRKATTQNVFRSHSPALATAPRQPPTGRPLIRDPASQRGHASAPCIRGNFQLHASYTTSLLPGGQRQLRVMLPALMLVVTSQDVLQSPDALAAVNDGASAGLTAIILTDSGTGDGDLFQAAVKLKEMLRDRALVLAMDRTDITTGAGLDGVILTSSGVPVVVARRMLPASGALVGCLVSSVDAAVTAAADGANLVLLEGEGGGVPAVEVLSQAMLRQRSGNAIPVVPFASGGCSTAQLQELVAFQADGLVVPCALLGGALAGVVGADDRDAGVAGVVAGVKARLGARGRGAAPAAPPQEQQEQQEQEQLQPAGAATSTIPRLHTAAFDALVQTEKELLVGALAFLGEVCPSMGEVSLLQDALASLDDPFLVVVVGEFNSGKSSVINALLGSRFLAEGVLPTTNEITVLRYGDPAGPADRPGRSTSADGFVERYLPAELLRELSVVDTPGTNVILERQQRLTEEFVPRADLVLFVMSMDRPFTESEVAFLEYIRRWKKKVVFVLNKADVLRTAEDLAAVTDFVKDNARRVLQLDDPIVLPVSARKALRAKMAAASAQGGLASDKDWEASQFGGLEGFLVQFFTGSSAGSAATDGEGIRLKLQTPVYVAEALLNAAQKVVGAELEAARASLEGVQAVAAQMQRFQREMVRDGSVQRTMCLGIVQAGQAKLEDYVDRTLTLSNLPSLLASSLQASSLTGEATASALQREALGESLQQFRAAVAEHANWLDTNISNQLAGYRTMVAGGNGVAASTPAADAPSTSGSGSRASIDAAEVFDLKAAAVLLEQEFKEAALGTAGAAAGAQGVGLVGASVMANTVEDLAALSLAGLASYLAVLNLPLRRAEIKSKLQRVASNFAKDVEGAMERELVAGVEGCVAEVAAMMAPLEATYVAEVAALEEAARKCDELQDRLRELLARIASL